MKRYLFSICVLFTCLESNADQTFVSGVDYSSVYSFDDFYVYVEDGAVLPSAITMEVPVHLYNSGYMSGPIYTNGKHLNIYNSGTVAGTINVTGGSEVIQHIRSDAEMNNVTVSGGGLKIEISDYQNANFNNIKDLNAESFSITNSSFVIDAFDDWQSWDANVSLESDVSLIVLDAQPVQSGQIINHSQSEHTLNVVMPNLDKMYKPEWVVVGDKFVLNIVRQTDYSVVFEDSDIETGSVLDLIRNKHGNDKLLLALDSANSREEIERLKGLSYRFNHKILLKPVKTINNLSLIDALKSNTESGVGISPYYTFSDKMNSFGGRIYAGYDGKIIYLNTGVSAHKFEYSDKLNDFSGMSYAFDIKSKQRFNKFLLGEIAYLSWTSFKADYVSANNKLKNNPNGLSWYGDVFVEYDFDVTDDVKVVPNLGFTYQRYNIADVSDTDSFLHVGADIKYSFAVDGIKYEYFLSGVGASNSDLSLTAGMGFVSIADGVGISADFGVLKDDYDLHYKISLNAKIFF